MANNKCAQKEKDSKQDRVAGSSSSVSKKISLYKTELCRTFEETGFCRYGVKCQFAHDADELRSVSRHPRYKTEICKTFWEMGNCPYGKRCCFIHTEKPTSNGSDNNSSTSNGKSATCSSQSSSSGRSKGKKSTKGRSFPSETCVTTTTISILAPQQATKEVESEIVEKIATEAVDPQSLIIVDPKDNKTSGTFTGKPPWSKNNSSQAKSDNAIPHEPLFSRRSSTSTSINDSDTVGLLKQADSGVKIDEYNVKSDDLANEEIKGSDGLRIAEPYLSIMRTFNFPGSSGPVVNFRNNNDDWDPPEAEAGNYETPSNNEMSTALEASLNGNRQKYALNGGNLHNINNTISGNINGNNANINIINNSNSNNNITTPNWSQVTRSIATAQDTFTNHSLLSEVMSPGSVSCIDSGLGTSSSLDDTGVPNSPQISLSSTGQSINTSNSLNSMGASAFTHARSSLGLKSISREPLRNQNCQSSSYTSSNNNSASINLSAPFITYPYQSGQHYNQIHQIQNPNDNNSRLVPLPKKESDYFSDAGAIAANQNHSEVMRNHDMLMYKDNQLKFFNQKQIPNSLSFEPFGKDANNPNSTSHQINEQTVVNPIIQNHPPPRCQTNSVDCPGNNWGWSDLWRSGAQYSRTTMPQPQANSSTHANNIFLASTIPNLNETKIKSLAPSHLQNMQKLVDSSGPRQFRESFQNQYQADPTSDGHKKSNMSLSSAGFDAKDNQTCEQRYSSTSQVIDSNSNTNPNAYLNNSNSNYINNHEKPFGVCVTSEPLYFLEEKLLNFLEDQ